MSNNIIIPSKKQTLRKNMLSLRSSSDKQDIERKSKEIFRRLKTVEYYKSANGVVLYSDYKNEVKTTNIILDVEASGRSVFLPVLVDDYKFIACKKSDMTQKNRYGIDEPYPIETAEKGSGKIDLIICPGLAFDYNLNRLGRGKGYYDRFLNDRKNIFKIGLAFEIQIVDNVYPDNHDVPMDMVITEKKIYVLNNKG